MYFVENIFSENEQKYLIYLSEKIVISSDKLAKPETNLSEEEKYFISPELRIISNYDFALNKILYKISEKLDKHLIIKESWITKTNGEKKYFHNHPKSNWSCIYYLKASEENCGTYFEKHGFVKCKINSLLIFDSKLNHKSPEYKNKETRITLVFDILEKLKLKEPLHLNIK